MVLIIVAAVTTAFTVADQNGKGTTSARKTQLVAGDSYDMFVNNIDMPMERNGIMADVLIPGAVGGIAGGKLQGKIFLYSGGFYMSGTTHGNIWANGMLSASRITDFVPGGYDTPEFPDRGIRDSRAQIYVVKSTDPDFGQSWQDWKTAVDLGADFYDGDHDGKYNPVDKNGNGKWDPTEDRPDILGDVTAWCVISDQQPSALRTFNEVNPQGIEIRETVFAFNSKGKAGNTIFVRYKIVNTGQVADTLDNVYFSVGADADVGDNGAEDLVGCDTTLNAGYTYHTANSVKWGSTPPCFMIDFFQGPKSYIPGVTFTDVDSDGVYTPGVDIAIDTATDVRGRNLGIQKIPGAKNLGLSSFFQYYNGIDPANSQQLRYYTLGEDQNGSKINPCTWTQGSVQGGVTCGLVDPYFMYSGDPVNSIGWINITPRDQRQISSTGPFKLISKSLPSGKRYNDTVTIVAAYVVGQGTSGLNSVTVCKDNDVTAQKIFDANFPSLPPPPPVDYTAKTGDGFIDLSWPTSKNILYRATDSIFQISRNVHGFYITQYYTNAQAPTNNNQPNSQVIARYDLADSIGDIYYKVANGGIDLRMPQAPAANKLDSLFVAHPDSGRILFHIKNDYSSGDPLIKGHEYYYSITEYTVNNWAVVNKVKGYYGPGGITAPGPGDYYDPTGNAVEEFESGLITVTMGIDEYQPSSLSVPVLKSTGPSSGSIKYLIADKTKLTGDKYKVDFFTDTNPLDGVYNPYWTLTNLRTGQQIFDSSRVYNFDTLNYSGHINEGFILKVQPLTPTIGTPYYVRNNTIIADTDAWYNPLSNSSTAPPTKPEGVYYPGKDIPQSGPFTAISTSSNVIETADRLRKVEIRFGAPNSGKAYRYLNGFQGTSILNQKNSNIYAQGITAADTTPIGAVRRGTVGNWDTLHSHANGFVDVPFTAWVVDTATGDQRQLSVGFFERRANLGTVTAFGGNPDGVWDPLDSVYKTFEVILVFDDTYDPTGKQVEYTGDSTKWADPVKGFALNPNIATAKQIAIAKSPWFNTLYIVALDKYKGRFFKSGDKFVIPVATYPYTSADEFQFTTIAGGVLSAADKKSLFEKVNVYPNPLYGYNPQTSYQQNTPDEPWVTFSNLPQDVTINIFTLSGTRLRTLSTKDKTSPTSPFLKWDLKNEAGLRAASGMYLAIVSCPGYGDKVLKFAIIMPQKQIKSY